MARWCAATSGAGSLSMSLRHRRNEPQAFLYAFDLLELNGTDLRREPIEVRKATLASILRKVRHGIRLNEHLEHPEGAVVFQHACKLGLRGHRLEAAGIALSIGTLAGLVEVQESDRLRQSGGRRRRIGGGDRSAFNEAQQVPNAQSKPRPFCANSRRCADEHRRSRFV